MKKSFLLFLSSIIAVFLITGCAEESKNNGGASTGNAEPVDIVVPEGTPTPIDLTSIDKYATLQGTYVITFFYTNGANIQPLSSDCASVPTYVSGASACNTAKDQVEMKGYGTILIDTQAQTGQIITKIQMTNDTMKNATGIFATLIDQQYNYTEFTPIPVSAISDTGINNGNTVKGTTGRNLTKNVNAPNSTYSFTVDTDKLTIINTMVDQSNIAPANVTVRMKKVSDEVVDLKVNNPLTTPAITGFVATAQ